MVRIKRTARVSRVSSSKSNYLKKQREIRRRMFGKSKSRSLTRSQIRKAYDILGLTIVADRATADYARREAALKRKLSEDKKAYAQKKRKLVSKSKSKGLSGKERSRARKMKLVLKSKTRKTKTSIKKAKAKLKSKLKKLKKKQDIAIKAHKKACKGNASKTLSKQLHSLAPSGAQIDKLTKRSYKKLRKDVNGKLTEIGKYRTKCNKNVRS